MKTTILGYLKSLFYLLLTCYTSYITFAQLEPGSAASVLVFAMALLFGGLAAASAIQLMPRQTPSHS